MSGLVPTKDDAPMTALEAARRRRERLARIEEGARLSRLRGAVDPVRGRPAGVPAHVEAALTALWALNHRGQAVAVQALSGAVPKKKRTRQAMMREVSEEYGIPLQMLLGTTRQQRVVWARQDAWYRMAVEGHNLHEIGASMNRDHTTVLHGCRRHAARCSLPDYWPVREAA